MNQDEIIAMAREAGFRTGHIDLTIGDPVPFIAPASGTSCIVEVQRFAALVAEKAAAKEREEIALEFDKRAVLRDGGPAVGWYEPDEPAEIVRARGTKEGV